MKIEGSHLFKSPGEKVWNCLIDPQVLARCIPGCEKLELAGEGSYNAVLKIGIGALKGTFISHIRLQDKEPLSQYKLVVEGEGGLGLLKGEGLIRLAASGVNHPQRNKREADLRAPVFFPFARSEQKVCHRERHQRAQLQRQPQAHLARWVRQTVRINAFRQT